MSFNRREAVQQEISSIERVQEACDATMRFACHVINEYLDSGLDDKELRRLERMLPSEIGLVNVLRKMKSIYEEKKNERN